MDEKAVAFAVAVALAAAVAVWVSRRTGPLIPRVIHQTHDLPFEMLADQYKRNTRRFLRDNPTFEYRYYSATHVETFIRARYGKKMLAIYRSIDPAYGPARADLFRYLLLYEEGGVYLDMKSGPTAPLDATIRDTDEFLLSNWCEGACGRTHWESFVHTGFGEYQQWWIACRPRHPFLRAVIDRCVQNIREYAYDPDDRATFGKLGVLVLTGPIAYTRAIHPLVAARPRGCRLVPSSLGGALQYNRIGFDHTTLYTRHYSTLRTPIVRARADASEVARRVE
jgi:mannosyltransferase OCH1-like enzyme